MSRFEGPRGLVGYARIETAEQQTVEVQQSSAVLSMTINGEVEGPFVWLRVTRSEGGAFAHLAVEDARELRDALSAWLADFGGEQPDRKPSDATLKELAPDLTRPGDMRSDLAYPSDAEVEAAASAMWDRYGPPGMFRYAPEQRQNSFRSDARAALLAAQEVRRNG